MAYTKIKYIIEQTVASGLIYLNSHASDFKNPEIRPYLDRYLRGSNGYKAEERGSCSSSARTAWRPEFGGRHELYEINYGGSTERSAVTACSARRPPGNADRFKASPRSAWRNTISTAEGARPHRSRRAQLSRDARGGGGEAAAYAVALLGPSFRRRNYSLQGHRRPLSGSANGLPVVEVERAWSVDPNSWRFWTQGADGMPS